MKSHSIDMPTCAIVGIKFNTNDWKEITSNKGEQFLFDFYRLSNFNFYNRLQIIQVLSRENIFIINMTLFNPLGKHSMRLGSPAESLSSGVGPDPVKVSGSLGIHTGVIFFSTTVSP